MKDFLAQITNHFEAKLPFVVYRKPQENTILAVLQQDSVLYTTEDYEVSGFVFAPFDAQKSTIVFPEHKSKKLHVTPKEHWTPGIHAAKSIRDSQSALQHKNIVAKGVDAIHKGALKKVILSRIEKVDIPPTDPIALFMKMSNQYPNAFCYCWYHPEIGLWLGATPETLFHLAQDGLKTMSLAGTKPFIKGLDVSWSSKELEEQQIVTDFITSQLRPIAEDLRVSERETVRAGAVVHLRTLVEAKLAVQKMGCKQLVDRLHPTPAVCGLPLASAKEFILTNEGYDRAYYTGFLGDRDVKNQTASFYVNLRCMQLAEEKAYLYVGGGITAASSPEGEYEETLKKAQTMLNILH